MKPLWQKIADAKLNTVWQAFLGTIEPEQGKFDFSVVDGISRMHAATPTPGASVVRDLEERHSSYPPDWLKKDYEKYPRMQLANGKSIEVSAPSAMQPRLPTPAPSPP